MSDITFAEHSTPHAWWQRWRATAIAIYLCIAFILLVFSVAGHIRLLSEVGKTFGGFTWTVDPDSQGSEIIVIAIPPQLTTFKISADSLSTTTRIIAVDGQKGSYGIEQAYQHVQPGTPITYTVQMDQHHVTDYMLPAVDFTLEMWWQIFGLAFLAGLSWLIVGAILLGTASDWNGGVEGITLIPPAMLLLLYSHWGNIQAASSQDLVIQLLWIPAFALLGATFIHLSLNYRPQAMSIARKPQWLVDGLPYAPVGVLLLYEWFSLLLLGHIPLRINIIFSLSYAALGGLISLSIGISSLWRIANLWSPWRQQQPAIPHRVRHYVGDLLALWIGGVGLGFCFGVLPILFTGQTLLPLPIFYVLAAVYPLILLYAIRSLRLITTLHLTIDQREDALNEQKKTAQVLQTTNEELQQATDLLLHADAHLRSLLSQRIHDQPRQQAQRIRSLLNYWQRRLHAEADRDQDGTVQAQPIIEALAKIQGVSEELAGDLHGLQVLVEDSYQRRSLGLKLHLQTLLQEDLPLLHPEAPLQVRADLAALDILSPDLENTPQGERIAEAISYTVTQALLNVYNHAGATTALVQAYSSQKELVVQISDNGRGFVPDAVTPEKTSLFKARLKVRAANGQLDIRSTPRSEPGTQILPPPTQGQGDPYGTTVTLHIPLSPYIDTAVKSLEANEEYRTKHREEEQVQSNEPYKTGGS